jgi:putative transcriptional regulator
VSTPSLRGRLLVASPILDDPNFARTVILVLDHGPDAGALGLVVNRPTSLTVTTAVPTWSDRVAEPAVVFVGGPVAAESAIGLATATAGDPGAPAADGAPEERDEDATDGFGAVGFFGLGTVDLSREPDDVHPAVATLRVFAGYAGWAPGQLEGEIDEGAWWVVDAEPGDAWSRAPQDLWRTVVRRQPGRLRFASTYPEDPALN